MQATVDNVMASLPTHRAFAALAAVLLDSRVSALTISELNPDHGAEDGSTLAAFVDRLVAALAGAPALLG